jgi:hypothetical protein
MNCRIGISAPRNVADARTKLQRWLAAAFAACLTACAGSPTTSANDGLHIGVKPKKTYTVDGRTLSFNEVESMLTATPPSRIVVEWSRQREGTACLFLIGTKLGIPVWTRSLNGGMHHVHFDLDSPDVIKIDDCR